MAIEVRRTDDGFQIFDGESLVDIGNGEAWGVVVDILDLSKSNFFLTSISAQCDRIREELKLKNELKD